MMTIHYNWYFKTAQNYYQYTHENLPSLNCELFYVARFFEIQLCVVP